MKVITKDVVLCDVDDTLVEWVAPPYNTEDDLLCLDFYGMPKYVREIKVHTEFLKSLKVRGYYVRVHSGNGALWAEQVVKALGLQDYVDSIETKPAKVIDDKPNNNWMPKPIYLRQS